MTDTQKSPNPRSLLIAHGSRLVCDLLGGFIEPRVEGVQALQAMDFAQLETLVRDVEDLHLALVDEDLPGLPRPDALSVITKVHPDCLLVIMADEVNAANFQAATQLDAAGFVVKSISAPGMIKVLELILSGEPYYPLRLPEIPGECAPKPIRVSSQEKPCAGAPFRKLTGRERETLQLVLKGFSNKEIARELEIAEVTVAFHLRHLFRKLGVSNRTQAALCASAAGWTEAASD